MNSNKNRVQVAKANMKTNAKTKTVKKSAKVKTATSGLGSYLKKVRQECGFSQMDLAKKLGYESPQFISDWEREVSSPPVRRINEIGKLLKVPGGKIFALLVEQSVKNLIDGLHEEYNSLTRGGSKR